MLVTILSVICGLMPFWLFSFWVVYDHMSGSLLSRFFLSLPFAIKSIPGLIWEIFHYKQTEAYAQTLHLIEVGNFKALLPAAIAAILANVVVLLLLALAIVWWVRLAKHHDEMTTKEKLTTPFKIAAVIIVFFFIIEFVLFLFAAVPFLFYLLVAAIIMCFIFLPGSLQAPIDFILLIFRL